MDKSGFLTTPLLQTPFKLSRWCSLSAIIHLKADSQEHSHVPTYSVPIPTSQIDWSTFGKERFIVLDKTVITWIDLVGR